MAERVVLDGATGALNLHAARISWSDVAGQGQGGPGKAHLRWMLAPWVGLPPALFRVWRGRDPGGGTKHELANRLDWEPVEEVGLPVTGEAFAATPYPLGPQGLAGEPRDPVAAAIERVARGAPTRGWHPGNAARPPLPEWTEAAPEALVRQILDSHLYAALPGLLALPPHQQADHQVLEDGAGRPDLRLLMHEIPGRLDASPSRAAWHPWPTLALAAACDPMAALAFGFGTAFEDWPEEDALFMVTVEHALVPGLPAVELADLVRPAPFLGAPAAPAPATRVATRTRPQRSDGPWCESIAVEWPLPSDPDRRPGLDAIPPPAAAYAIARYGPGPAQREILLSPRPGGIGGYLPHVPGGDDLGRFVDHVCHSSNGAPDGTPSLLGGERTYAVAAQDIFGRYGPWAEVGHLSPREEPCQPQLLEVALSDDGTLRVMFGWDWSDRSPAFVELSAAWADAPGVPIAQAICDFGGDDAPDAGAATIRPLDLQRAAIDGFGAAQDPAPPEGEPGAPGFRSYLWTAALALDFSGQPWREVQVVARGQAHLHRKTYGPWNVSAWTPPRRSRVLNPARPPAPALLAPDWASLPDAAGISRALLTWGAHPAAAGWHVFEASETALRAALNLPETDLEADFVTRRAEVEQAAAANWRACRDSFRRLTGEPLPAHDRRWEQALPRGSRLIHVFVVLAVGPNGRESDWAGARPVFVAAPRARPPEAPVLAAQAATGPARAVLAIETGPRAAVVEVFRLRAAAAPEPFAMGPPIATLPAAPQIAWEDAAVAPGWSPAWYRAVAWSAADDRTGLVEARSGASAAVPVLVAPEGPPEIEGAAVWPGSTAGFVRIDFALRDAVLDPTPLGPHRLVVERRGGGARLDATLDTVPRVAAGALPGPPADGSPGMMAAVEGTVPPAFAVWLPRGEGPFDLRIKAIDPLGRVGERLLAIPAFDPADAVVVIPPWRTRREVLEGDDMGVAVESAEALGLVVDWRTDQQNPAFADEEIISILPPAGTPVARGTTVTVTVNLAG